MFKNLYLKCSGLVIGEYDMKTWLYVGHSLSKGIQIDLYIVFDHYYIYYTYMF